MTSSEISLIRRTFASVGSTGDFGMRFYTNLFHTAPSLKDLFKRVDIVHQASALTKALEGAVQMIDNPAELADSLAALGQRHHSYGVLPVHYDLVGRALINTLKETPGTKFSDEAESAWKSLFSFVRDSMLRDADC